MTKWKYMTQQFPTSGFQVETISQRNQGEMSLMGEYGWELVSTATYHNTEVGEPVVVLFYKKPVEEPRPMATPGPVARGR